MAKLYYLKRTQLINAPMEKVWGFFSRPENLNQITPDKVKFKITSKSEDIQQMYEGMLIAYKISPFLNIYFNWVTEITNSRENQFFIDEQRMGPYRLWHHEHHFTETADGVLMTDKLTYSMPYGIIGRFAHAAFIKKQVEEIFNHRYEVIEKIFRRK